VTDGNGLLGDSNEAIDKEVLQNALYQISKESIWRVKGFVRLKSGSDSDGRAQSQVHILNWAFGRHDLTPFLSESGSELEVIRLTVMGERGEVRRAIRRFSESLSAQVL
jgi:G3E family GTPase